MSSSNGSNDKNDRPDDEGVAGSASMEEETSRKRPFKSLAQDVSSNTYSRDNNNIRSGSCDGEQMNESIPEGLESMVRRMVSTATQDIQNRMDTIQNENKELKDKCNELEIKVKDLTLKNEYNEWSYTAEDIPALYWIERGFSEEYAECMAEFLGRIKEYTHQLRRGESRVMALSFANGHMFHMSHDDIILPHLKEFLDALVQYQKFNHREDYGLRYFGIRNIQLEQEVMDMLAPVLNTNTGIKRLHFSRLNVRSEVISFVADIIEHNSYIQCIGWHGNRIENLDDMRRFCNQLRRVLVILLNPLD